MAPVWADARRRIRYLAPFIETPTFALQSKFDAWSVATPVRTLVHPAL
jgi:hypothetical protein